MSHASAALLGNTSLSPPPSSSAVASPSVAQWESLRKKSRLLETQLYKKLQEFAHIQTAIMNEGRTGKSNSKAARADLESATAASAAAASAASGLSPLLQYDSCCSDLNDLLRLFSDVIEGLSRLLTDHPSLASDSNNYILTKSRTMLQDNQLEFRRTQANIQAAITRAELLSGATSRRDADPAMRGRTQELLREEKGLHQSLRMTDEVIDAARTARDSLSMQGSVFTGVRGKLGNLAATYPIVGKVMQQINVKHNRDMIVLACVIACCLIFTFLYVMSKP